MEILRIIDLTASYGTGPAALTGVHLDVRAGEVVALLGASGSGKSTLLRCIAGLHPLLAGQVQLDGKDVAGTPVEQRGIGLVFQDHALFPHRDVAGNVAFGPRMQGLDPTAIAQRVDTALRSVSIAALRDRAVDELSGGEQQRVALARALASHPHLLLLDEPYGSLDRPLRERLLADLPALVAGTERGALLVTHDQQEALRVADRIAVLVGGELRQLDTPERVWSAPVDADVAAFLDVGALLNAEVRAGSAHGAFGQLQLPGTAEDGPVHLLLPRTALRLAAGEGTVLAGDAGDSTSIGAQVVGLRFGGDHHRVEVALGDGTRVAVRTEHLPTSLAVGTDVTLTVATEQLRTFPAPASRPAQ